MTKNDERFLVFSNQNGKILWMDEQEKIFIDTVCKHGRLIERNEIINAGGTEQQYNFIVTCHNSLIKTKFEQ